jgi:O-antigen/teichoic acid export membrane protein
LLALGAQLPVLLLGSFYGTKAAGIFGLAYSMIHLPMDLIGLSVAQVYYAEIAKYGKNNPQQIYLLSVSITKKLLWIGLIPLGIIILLGPWLFQIIFGSEWYDAGIYARFLIPYIMVAFISTPLASVFNVFEKQSYQLILNILRIISVLFVFIICKIFNFSALNTIMLYSIIMILYFVFMTLFLFRMIKKEIKNYQ